MNALSTWALVAAMGLMGCAKKDQGSGESASTATKTAEKPAAAAPAPEAAEASGDPVYDPEAALRDPSKADLTAPEKFSVKLDTTKGEVIIDVTRAWAPNGADRFYNLVKSGYFDDTAFFRVIGGFMAQIGISGEPELNQVWREARIPDDPVKESNRAGYVTFAAASAPNSRTTQVFINYGNNVRLDDMRFAPFGKVRDMGVVTQLYAGYGEGAPRGRGPSQERIQREGNGYLKQDFPELDYIKTATLLDE